MPDSDLDKPGTTAPAQSAGHEDAARDPQGEQPKETIEDELDRLLLEIDAAVEELDPTGDLEYTAAKARNDAVVGDPEYDELEDMFEVVVPSGSATPETDEAVPADTGTSEVDDQLDELIDEAKGKESQAAAGQIDQELDALLNEAQTLLDPEPQTESNETADHADADLSDEQPSASAATAEPEGVEVPVEDPSDESAPVAENKTESMKVEEPSPAAEDATESPRTIEDLDADLADRAENAVEAQTADETDDAFRSSEDVVEEVIEEVASVSEDLPEATEPERQDNDELAQLMAESPASSDLGVGSGPSKSAPAARADAKAAGDSKNATSPVAAASEAKAQTKPAARVATMLSVVTRGFRPAALRTARVLSKPLELVPPRVRDDIGWLASVTLFLAFAVLIALALFR